MPIFRGKPAPEPSPTSDRAGPTDVRHRHREPGIKLDCGTGPDVRHVGIVFVHGIGSQQAGDTLLDWGGAMVRVLLDARVQHKTSADPVIDVQLDVGPSDSRFIEVQLPKVAAGNVQVAEQHWVMTEAWWAQRVRPPAFGQMAEWLGTGGAIRRIVDALISRKKGVHDPRLRPAIAVYPLRHGPTGAVEEAAPAGPEIGMRRGRDAVRFAGNLYLQAVSALLLVLYGLLRTIEKLLPVGPLKDGALTRPLDSFVLQWFGDVYVLLSDAAQAASVRSRLVDALDDLAAAKCDEIAIVAHSGGAIVSYMTLVGAPEGRLKVDRLITLGEGLNLAWQLVEGEQNQGADNGAVQYDRLFGNLLAKYEKLRWDDFWASQDPAPVGILKFPSKTAPDNVELERVRSHGTWNRLSFSEDHGGYWDNDEEFLIPVLRLLEGRPGGGALFGDETADARRSNKRRRRLSLLSLLRQTCIVAPTAGIVIAFAIGSQTAFHLSDAVATAWSWIPGTSWLSDTLNGIRSQQFENVAAIRFLAETGVWLVAAAVAGSAAFSLLAPPERHLPWETDGKPELVGRVLQAVPFIVAIPVLIAVAYGAIQFLSGSTSNAIDVGEELVLAVVAIVVVVLLGDGVRFMGGQPDAGAKSSRQQDRSTGWEYGIRAVQMVIFMAIVGALVLAPVVSAVVYKDVGRTIVGSVTIVLAFQALGRLGSWRWSVWDHRERDAARTGSGYRSVGRVVGQFLVIAVMLGAAFLAVVYDSREALVVTAVAVITLVLVGVAIDVLDAVRQERESPADSIRRSWQRGA